MTETWLDENIDFDFNIVGYNKYDMYRNSHGGGITIYCRSSYNIELNSNFSFISDEIEILTLKAGTSDFNFIISCIYRPPSFNIDTFNEFLSNNMLPSIANFEFVICGDFNINLFNPFNLNVVNNFITAMAGHSFYPVIDKPTRMSPENSSTKLSLIDHIWLNFIPHDNIQSSVLEFEVSDHMPVLLKFNISTDIPEENNVVTYRKLKNENNMGKFIDAINNANFDENNISDPNCLAENFINKVYDVFNKSFPIHKVKEKLKNKGSEWLNDDLRFLIKKKRSLLILSNRGVIFRRSYTKFRNILTSLLRKSKQIFYQNKLVS